MVWLFLVIAVSVIMLSVFILIVVMLNVMALLNLMGTFVQSSPGQGLELLKGVLQSRL